MRQRSHVRLRRYLQLTHLQDVELAQSVVHVCANTVEAAVIQ